MTAFVLAVLAAHLIPPLVLLIAVLIFVNSLT